MQLGRLTEQTLTVPPDWSALEVSGLTADSRMVEPGYLFAALAGTKADGTRYVGQAVESGAVAILASADAAIGDCAVPVIRDGNPRHALAMMAARFYGAQPETMAAVTGTNGKTSVAGFLREIWQACGLRGASVGTIGIVTPEGTSKLQHTTPDPVELHRILAELAEAGITHCAIEASSHGLAQCRVDGVRLAAGAFTNISRDHLDYHHDFEDYFAQKMRLFTALLPAGAGAVIDADSDVADRVIAAARSSGLKVVTVGHAGETIRLTDWARDGYGQRLAVEVEGRRFDFRLPLVGDFQTSNALVAAGLAMVTGCRPDDAVGALETLRGASGRLELVGRTKEDAAVFVDYSHTPDALANALDALRPYATGRLVVVFGAGGDRDKGKRPEMGAVAAEKSDVAYVTDDNPRSEVPATIRAQIMAATPGGIEVGDRAEAIAAAIDAMGAGDVLLVAGKGHETGQIVGDRVIPFSDQAVVRDCLEARGGHV